MSKLKEYLDLVRKGIPNIDRIAEGLINQVKMEYDFLPEHEQEEITRRRLICQECPLFSLNAKNNDTEYKNYLMSLLFLMNLGENIVGLVDALQTQEQLL